VLDLTVPYLIECIPLPETLKEPPTVETLALPGVEGKKNPFYLRICLVYPIQYPLQL